MSAPLRPVVPGNKPWWANNGWLAWFLHDKLRIENVKNQLLPTFNDFFPDYSDNANKIMHRRALNFVQSIKQVLSTHQKLVQLIYPNAMQLVELNNSRKAINNLLNYPRDLIESQFASIFWIVILRLLRLQVVTNYSIREIFNPSLANESEDLCKVINQLVALCEFQKNEKRPLVPKLDANSMNSVLQSIVDQMQLPKLPNKARRRTIWYYIQSVRGTIMNLQNQENEENLVAFSRVLVQKLKQEKRFFSGEYGSLADVNPDINRFFVWSTWPRMPVAQVLPSGQVQLPIVVPNQPSQESDTEDQPPSPTSSDTSDESSNVQQQQQSSALPSRSLQSASNLPNDPTQVNEEKSMPEQEAYSPDARPDSPLEPRNDRSDDELSDFEDDLPASSRATTVQTDRPIMFDAVSMLAFDSRMTPRVEVEFLESQRRAFDVVFERMNMVPSSQEQRDDVFAITQNHLFRLMRISTQDDRPSNLERDWTTLVSLTSSLLQAAGSNHILPSADQAERATLSSNNLSEPWRMLAETIDVSCREMPMTNTRATVLVIALQVILGFLYGNFQDTPLESRWYRAAPRILVRLLTDLMLGDMRNFLDPNLVRSVLKRNYQTISPNINQATRNKKQRSEVPPMALDSNVPAASGSAPRQQRPEVIQIGSQSMPIDLVSPTNSIPSQPGRPKVSQSSRQSNLIELDPEPSTQVRVRLAEPDQPERQAELVREPANGRFASPVDGLVRSDVLMNESRPTVRARARSIPNVDDQDSIPPRPSSPLPPEVSPAEPASSVRKRSLPKNPSQSPPARPSSNVSRPNIFQRYFGISSERSNFSAGSSSARQATVRPPMQRATARSKASSRTLRPFVFPDPNVMQPSSVRNSPFQNLAAASQPLPLPSRSLYDSGLRSGNPRRIAPSSDQQLPLTVKASPTRASRQVIASLERQNFRLSANNQELSEMDNSRRQMALETYQLNLERDRERRKRAIRARDDREAAHNKRLNEVKQQAAQQFNELEAEADRLARENNQLRNQLTQVSANAVPNAEPTQPSQPAARAQAEQPYAIIAPLAAAPGPESPPPDALPRSRSPPISPPPLEPGPPNDPQPAQPEAQPEAERDALTWLLFAYIATE